MAEEEYSEILRIAKSGLPFKDTEIIDVHGHMGPYYNMHIPWNDAAGMLQTMDALGIDKVCVASMTAITADYKLGNDIVAQAMKEYPGRFIGYAAINPNYAEDIVGELERCFDKMGMSGIKVHPVGHNYPVDGPNYRMVWEFARAHQCPLLGHSWSGDRRCDAAVYDKLAGEYPQLNFILGHSGGEEPDAFIEVAKKRDNVYLDLTTSKIYFGLVERFVREVGPDKLLYGSDIPFLDARAQLGKVIYAKISDRDKEKILSTNAKRLFKF